MKTKKAVDLLQDLGQEKAVVLAGELVDTHDKVVAALSLTVAGLTIETAEELEVSTGLLQEVKRHQTELEDLRRSITKPMDEAKKRVMDLFKPAKESLEAVERTIKNAVLSYTREQERIQREAQAELDRKAELERQRLLRLAEKRREEEKPEKADTFQERAEEVEAPVAVQAKVPSGAVHVRTTWRAVVTDLAALAAACAEGNQPLEMVEPNMLLLNKLARAEKDGLKIPGVEAVSERDVAARG